jgi:hypothetical protein
VRNRTAIAAGANHRQNEFDTASALCYSDHDES